jgi:putative membrane protein insertion efficiency factor
MKRILLKLIEFYQKKISVHTARRCRYYPTCSAYAKTAITLHGAGKGTLLAIMRLLRCNQFARGGVDKVPTDFKIYMKAVFGGGKAPHTRKM